jgi:hypothetical protein
MSATIRSWNACSRDLHSRANLTYWLSALLFGFLFVLLILIMSWLLRTIVPIGPSMIDTVCL